MRRLIVIALGACAVLSSTGCMATRDIPSNRGQAVKVEAAKAVFKELQLEPTVEDKTGVVTSRWSWCGDRSPGALVAMFPLTWARYKATPSADKLVLTGEAWGANGLLIFGILPGALVNIPLPFPMNEVEEKLALKLKD